MGMQFHPYKIFNKRSEYAYIYTAFPLHVRVALKVCLNFTAFCIHMRLMNTISVHTNCCRHITGDTRINLTHLHICFVSPGLRKLTSITIASMPYIFSQQRFPILPLDIHSSNGSFPYYHIIRNVKNDSMKTPLIIYYFFLNPNNRMCWLIANKI